MKNRVANQPHLLFLIVGIIAMLAGCADEVGILQQPADVRCEAAKVWAGPGGASPLPQLKDCGSGLSGNWHSLPAGGWVTADESGEAWIDIAGCLTIYLFQHGELLKSGCPEVSSGIVCSITGTSVYNNMCSSEIIIQTPSAQLVLEGTWLSVTYLPEIQLTLILVAEGAVDVQPVLDFEEYTLGDATRVGEGNFLFTAPGPEPPVIAGLPGRQAIPFEELPPVIEELIFVEPTLERWLERVRVRAEEDNVSFPDLTAISPPPAAERVFLAGVGDPWENELVQEAILHLVDWGSLTKRVFDEPVPVALIRLDPSGQEIVLREDAASAGYDPGLALALLEEAGFGEGLLLELVPFADDESVMSMAELMGGDLEEFRIGVRVTPYAGDLPAVGIPPEPQGQLVLQLTRR